MHEGHRQRLISKLTDGKSLLSDHEILEILLFYAIPRKNVNELSHRLINTFGSLLGVFEADYDSLLTVEGVGEKTAAFLVTLGEIGKRSKECKNKTPIIYSFDACKQLLIDSYRGAQEEKFVALFLDKQGRVILRKIFCSHSDNMVSFDISDFLKGVISRKPHSVVLCHNHLSGNPTPSFSDDKATEQIYASLKLHNVILNDHIIIAGEKAFSYRATDRLALIAKKINNALF